MKAKLHRHFRWTLYSCLVGIFAGSAASLFLYSLDWITHYRQTHPHIIWGLPIVGFSIGWLYHNHGRSVSAGHNLILEEIHDPKKITPLRMAPLIYLSTLLTHLVGGSAGREGTAVQMGASLADQLAKFFKVEPHERKILLMAGTGAGFAAAIGAPWAGAIFGMEVIHIGRLKIFAFFEILVASFVAYFFAIIVEAPHSVFPSIGLIPFNLQTLLFVLIAGTCFGIAARAFITLTHVIENILSRFVTYPPFKPLLAGGLILLLFYCENPQMYFSNKETSQTHDINSYLETNQRTEFKYAGLGIETIQDSFRRPSPYQESLWKTLFTSLTVGSGFKGGEFIPLVFIGSTLGSALALILPISFQLLASLGFAAVFAGASNTPIACAIMAMEIFGYQIGPYALLACLTSYYTSGRKSIYKSQKLIRPLGKTL
jgi:H+/Cl- antiporter ClcA